MRVTNKYLKARVERINKIVGKDVYSLYPANGGYALHKVSGDGYTDVFNYGTMSAKDLDFCLAGFIEGLFNGIEEVS